MFLLSLVEDLLSDLADSTPSRISFRGRDLGVDVWSVNSLKLSSHTTIHTLPYGTPASRHVAFTTPFSSTPYSSQNLRSYVHIRQYAALVNTAQGEPVWRRTGPTRTIHSSSSCPTAHSSPRIRVYPKSHCRAVPHNPRFDVPRSRVPRVAARRHGTRLNAPCRSHSTAQPPPPKPKPPPTC